MTGCDGSCRTGVVVVGVGGGGGVCVCGVGGTYGVNTCQCFINELLDDIETLSSIGTIWLHAKYHAQVHTLAFEPTVSHAEQDAIGGYGPRGRNPKVECHRQNIVNDISLHGCA